MGTDHVNGVSEWIGTFSIKVCFVVLCRIMGIKEDVMITTTSAYPFKVTLFESLKVVKAKKTQPLKLTEDQGNFDETFSILFPISYMDQVILEFKY